MTTIIYLVLIFFFSGILVKATDILIVNLKGLAEKTSLGKFAISSFLIALGTSLPELIVGLTAALEKQPSLSLGNVIGANIANLSLVVGGAALVGGAVTVRGVFVRRDIFYAFLAGAAPMVLLFDKTLTRVDGLILLFVYGFYNTWVFYERRKTMAVVTSQLEKEGFIHRLIRRLNHRGTRREIGWIFLGLALLLFAGEMIVRLSKQLAIIFNLPLLLVGLLVVSVGTTLPEIIFELKAVRQHQPDMVFGNLLGSIVANGTLVIGLVAFISPFRIQAFNEYLLATMAFLIIFAAFYFFIHTKHRLERREGALLLVFYLAFALIEFASR